MYQLRLLASGDDIPDILALVAEGNHYPRKDIDMMAYFFAPVFDP